jgi:hypothetical protein
MIRYFSSLLAASVILTGCASTEVVSDGQVVARGDTRYVGVFIPQQNPTVDRLTRGNTADEYFMPVWTAFEQGRVQGASALVEVYLEADDGSERSLYNGPVNGFRYIPIDRSALDANTLLCVRVPWQIIAHQRVNEGGDSMCDSGADAYFQNGRGRTADDAWGVIAIAPVGLQ